MNNPGHENIFKAVKRLVQETKAPIKQVLLKAVGLQAHGIRVIVNNRKLYEVSGSNMSGSRLIENEGYWMRFLKPASLQILNQSNTEPTITGVNLFTELDSAKTQLSFFQAGVTVMSWRWTKDYFTSSNKEEIFQLPTLKRGTVVTIDFDDKAWIEPTKTWLQPFLAELNETKEERRVLSGERLYYANEMANRENPNLREQLDSDDRDQNKAAMKLLNRYETQFDEEHKDNPLVKIEIEAQEVFKCLDTCYDGLQSWLAVTLDDEVMLPFKWANEQSKFEAGFYSSGVSGT